MFLLVFYSFTVNAQALEDKTHIPTIQTVLFQGNDVQDPYPILNLSSNGVLNLSFDDFSADIYNLTYTFVHCDYNWVPSDLMKNQYIDGMFYDYVVDVQTSSNTYKPFNHYKLSFPNDQIKPKLSGNYVLKVYNNGDENDLVLTKRFFVIDFKVNFQVNIHRPSETRFYNNCQEVDFKVNVSNAPVLNATTDYKVMVRQNGRWDNAILNLEPRFYSANELSYNYESENVFKGGNEFRAFDLRQARFGGQMLQKVFQDSSGMYNAILYADKTRADLGHTFTRDLNGHYVIESKNVYDNDLECDYIKTHFRLLSTYPLESDLYLMGTFSNWKALEKYKLKYDKKNRMYVGSFPFKQGYYNYAYISVNKDGTFNFADFEGDYFQTENEYEFFFYMYDRQLNCDLLVGYRRVNSMWGDSDF